MMMGQTLKDLGNTLKEAKNDMSQADEFGMHEENSQFELMEGEQAMEEKMAGFKRDNFDKRELVLQH